jgi:ABC-type multidrug transport system permease subunit
MDRPPAAGRPRALPPALRVGWVLYRRDLVGTLLSPSVYAVVTAACLLLTFFMVSYLDTVSSLAVFVSEDPARIPLFFTMAFLSLYLGVASSISISAEREHRTFEVLFYGPVTPLLRLLSIFLRDLAVFLLAAVVFLLDLWIVSRLTNLSLGPGILRSIGFSFFLVWPMIGFSLLLSSLTRRVRKAVLLFVTIFVALAGLQIAAGLLSSIPAESISLFLLYVRRTLSALLQAAQWVSPFAYIARLNEPMGAGSPAGIGWILLAGILYAAVLLALAVLVLKKSDKSS